jgi:hypothetical protein
VRNTDPRKPVKDLVVHFLVTREASPDARIPPGPQKGGVLDTVLGTDLEVRGTTSGNFRTPIYEPGTYLVEIELLDVDGVRRQFCALDLQVEGP